MIVENFRLEPGSVIPNNPRLPVIVYRQVFDDKHGLAVAFEDRFTVHGWRGLWRNGIYDYHHYHSGAHEVLGIARGAGRVMLGGPEGMDVTLAAGDCVLLPAGTGHCRLSASPDFLVIGGYPPGQHADMQIEAPDAAMLATIRDCPLPDDDPIEGGDGALASLWRRLAP